MDRLPEELVTAVLGQALPSTAIATAFAAHVQAERDFILVAWAHAMVGLNDDSVLDGKPNHGAWEPPREIDASMYPDTRGLATRATWYMRRLVAHIPIREAQSSPYMTIKDVVPPHAFQVPVVLDFLYSRHHLAMLASRGPLDAVLREWDVVTHEVDGALVTEENKRYQFRPTPAQEAMMAEPRLRLMPEGLQVPALLLYGGDIALFKLSVTRLIAGLPTLATATAPIQLWTRFGLDDRRSMRAAVSLADDGQEPFAGANEHTTLPMLWALIAAAEGQAEALDHLVQAAHVDVSHLIKWFSYEGPSRTIFRGLQDLPDSSRAVPTWRWLTDRGYVFPRDSLNYMSNYLWWGANADTYRLLVLEHDIPILEYIAGPRDRQMAVGVCLSDIVYTVSAGHTKLLHDFADHDLLDPVTVSDLIAQVYECSKDEDYGYERKSFAELVPLLVDVCLRLDGGVASVIEAGMGREKRAIALLFASIVSPDTLPSLIAGHAERSGILAAILDLPDALHEGIQFGSILKAEVERLAYNTLDKEHQQRLLATVLLHATHRPGPLGGASLRALYDLTPQRRLHLFALAALIPPPDTASYTKAAFLTPPPDWTLWQIALDYLLPTFVGDADELVVDEPLAHMISLVSKRCPTTDETAAELATHGAHTADEVRTWALVKIATVAPAYFSCKVTYLAQSPAWIWQVRANVLAINHILRPAPLPNWKALLAVMMGNQHIASARALIRCLYLESQAKPTSQEQYEPVLKGLSNKYPAVLEYAKEAGFAL
ncbi:hypothetical protein BC828DRAFT_441223 [Blastocladiella britannica]|nr:hypothetical protein BC828DRAFT_441223 [Blastocladiella britannica]